jgi:hypothetical protein
MSKPPSVQISSLNAILLVLLVSGTAPAQTAQQPGADPAADVDIAGVKLGMTPEEAIEALRKFDTWPVLSKRYASGYPMIGVLGSTDACKRPVQQADPLRMMGRDCRRERPPYSFYVSKRVLCQGPLAVFKGAARCHVGMQLGWHSRAGQRGRRSNGGCRLPQSRTRQ